MNDIHKSREEKCVGGMLMFVYLSSQMKDLENQNMEKKLCRQATHKKVIYFWKI